MLDMEMIEPLSLGNTPKDKWFGSETTDPTKALDRLLEDKEYHLYVLQQMNARIKFSADHMSRFYSRWQVAEKKVQAYVPVKDYEACLKAWEEQNRDPENPHYRGPIATNIVVPYAYATIMTIVTYHLQTFAGRRPMFSLGSNSGAAEQSRLHMETLLQWNADHERLVQSLYQFLFDAQVYGVGILRTAWKEEKKWRTVWENNSKTRKEKAVFQGTEVTAIDPFMFFPDPRVPMSKVATAGEFCFFRSYTGKHTLLQLEAAGIIKGVNRAGDLPGDDADKYSKSLRGMVSNGDETPGRTNKAEAHITNFIRVDQGTCVVNPQELGLGPENVPEKWMFTILNGRAIVQAERFDTDHDKHPVAITEPYVQGYGFGQPSMADMVGPLQDTLSWFVNSHMRNVRTAINNMWLADPSKIEVQDLLNPAPGKVIRLKRTAYGSDVKQALQQLAVTDVTRNHMNDLQLFTRLADSMTGVTDNIRGLQDAGGRKTATEVRTTTDAGASRLAAQARIISAQGVVDLVDMMICNIQQYSTDEFVGSIIGSDGLQTFRIQPSQVSGDFYFPIMDGTLPLDRVAMLDIWKEIWLGISQSQQLSAEYDGGKIFQYMSELSGVKNLSSFKRMPMPGGAPMVPGLQVPAGQEQIAKGVQSGALQPLPGAALAGMGLR